MADKEEKILEDQKTEIIWIYTGGGFGGSQHGIPARDLTADDMVRLRNEEITIHQDDGTEKKIKLSKLVEICGLYEKAQKDGSK